MVRVCLDIDILLDFLMGDEKAEEKLSIYLNRKDAELCVASTTLSELYVAVRNPSIVDELADHVVILPITEEVAQKVRDVFDYMDEYEKVKMSHVYVASACLAHEAVLLTKNRQRYSNIPGLKVL
ncbi:MAG: hypothetical protein D6769_00815 [Methanobacteriota archaeon]|nr:MAG: hypothetical protein D6769_00815 [Euryarchaeota archaeon]